MSGRGSTIFSQKMAFHSLSHRRVASSLQVPLAVPGVSQKQRCCGAGVSVHTFPDAELSHSPTAVGNTAWISPWLRDTNPGCHRRAWEWPPHTAKDPREGGIFVVTTSGGTGRAPTEERKPSGSRGVFGEENNSKGLLLPRSYLLVPDTAQQVLDIY